MQVMPFGIGAVYFLWSSSGRLVGGAEGKEGNEGDALEYAQDNGKVFRNEDFYVEGWNVEDEHNTRS